MSLDATSAWTLAGALVAAALAGELFARVHLPKVTGYLLVGMLAGPYLGGLITRPMARDLQLVNGLAIALIALIAGLELNYRRLRPRLSAIARFGGITVVAMYGILTPLVWLGWRWLGIHAAAIGSERIALALLLTTIIVSFSPTVTIAIITDSRARGPLSEMSLAVVVIADLALIILFTVALQFVRWTTGTAQVSEAGLLARLAWEILGSCAFGAVLGAACIVWLRHVWSEATVALLALCVALSALGPLVHVEPLLAGLAAGMVIENIGQASGDALKLGVDRAALPIFVVFFAAAGASLPLDGLASIGFIAAAVAVVRLASIRIASAVALRWSGVPDHPGRLVWMSLVSQAGVTLGLTVLVAREFPEWGVPLQSLMIALIAIHELIGPVLFRTALRMGGEIGSKGFE